MSLVTDVSSLTVTLFGGNRLATIKLVQMMQDHVFLHRGSIKKAHMLNGIISNLPATLGERDEMQGMG